MSNRAGMACFIICDPGKGFFIYAQFSGRYSAGVSMTGSTYAERVHTIAFRTHINLTSLAINMRYRKASVESSGRVSKILV